MFYCTLLQNVQYVKQNKPPIKIQTKKILAFRRDAKKLQCSNVRNKVL